MLLRVTLQYSEFRHFIMCDCFIDLLLKIFSQKGQTDRFLWHDLMWILSSSLSKKHSSQAKHLIEVSNDSAGPGCAVMSWPSSPLVSFSLVTPWGITEFFFTETGISLYRTGTLSLHLSDLLVGTLGASTTWLEIEYFCMSHLNNNASCTVPVLTFSLVLGPIVLPF